MTQEEFIEILDNEGYSYEIVGDRIVVTEKGNVHLVASKFTEGDDVYFYIIDSIPPGVIFKNKGLLNLSSLEKIPDDVEFRNIGDIDLGSIHTSEISSKFLFKNTGSISFSNKYWSNKWEGNIEGIDNKRLLNLMIKDGVFER
jgi:hypothetical protein